jgi:hypothetical protein
MVRAGIAYATLTTIRHQHTEAVSFEQHSQDFLDGAIVLDDERQMHPDGHASRAINVGR